MKPVIRWTLWQRRWSIFWWSIGVAALIAINIAFYPSFSDQSQQLEETFRKLPETAKSLISDTQDFLTPEGFLSSQVYYLMLPLLLSVMTIGLGSRLLAREEEEGTIELLLSRPITRGRLLAAKALAGLAIIGIVGAVALAAALVMCAAVDMGVPLTRIMAATGLAALIATLFGAFSYFITTVGGRAKLASVGIPAALAIGGYITVSLAKVVDWLDWPAKFLPYYYYRPGEVLNGFFDWWNPLLLGLVILALGFYAWRFFNRRDISG